MISTRVWRKGSNFDCYEHDKNLTYFTTYHKFSEIWNWIIQLMMKQLQISKQKFIKDTALVFVQKKKVECINYFFGVCFQFHKHNKLILYH